MHSINAVEEAQQWQAAAERWREHARRNDSLGETARRMHTKALARSWAAESNGLLWGQIPIEN